VCRGKKQEISSTGESNEPGSANRYDRLTKKGQDDVAIACIENVEGLDVVLYTQIGTNITSLTASKLAELAIKSAGERYDRRDGISYLFDAKRHGIKTPLSEDYEAEIKRRLNVSDLEEALAKARA
jgi:hypothetical protein